MKRIIMMLTLAALLVAAFTATAPLTFAAPPDCDEQAQGCKTTTTTTTQEVDDPSKNNPKFFETVEVTTEEEQRGNFNSGTDDATYEEDTSSEQIDCQNPSGKPNGPTCR